MNESISTPHGVSVQRIGYAGHHRWGRHAHEQASVFVVTRGCYRETIWGGDEFTCEAGDIVVKPPGVVHADEVSPAGAAGIMLELAPSLVGPLLEHDRGLLLPRHLRGGPVRRIARELQVETGLQDGASPIAIESLLFEVLTFVARQGRASAGQVPVWLARARDRILAEYHSGISLRDLAIELQIDRARLARAFRHHLGCSVGEYVRRLRLSAAVEAMLSSERPLAQIAVEAGFYDQSHFGRAFRRRYGVSPSRFRLTHARTKDSHPS